MREGLLTWDPPLRVSINVFLNHSLKLGHDNGEAAVQWQKIEEGVKMLMETEMLEQIYHMRLMLPRRIQRTFPSPGNKEYASKGQHL